MQQIHVFAAQQCAAISLVRCKHGTLRTQPRYDDIAIAQRKTGENPGKRNINQNENRFKAVVQARSLRICDTVVQRRMKRCALRHTGSIPPAPPERPLQSRRLIL